MYIVYGIPIKRDELLNIFKDELKTEALTGAANERRWDGAEWNALWDKHSNMNPSNDTGKPKFVRDLCKLINCVNPDVAIDIFNDVIERNTATITHYNRKLFEYPGNSKFYGELWIYGAGICTDLVDISDEMLCIDDLDLPARYKPVQRGFDSPHYYVIPSAF